MVSSTWATLHNETEQFSSVKSKLEKLKSEKSVHAPQKRPFSNIDEEENVQLSGSMNGPAVEASQNNRFSALIDDEVDLRRKSRWPASDVVPCFWKSEENHATIELSFGEVAKFFHCGHPKVDALHKILNSCTFSRRDPKEIQKVAVVVSNGSISLALEAYMGHVGHKVKSLHSGLKDWEKSDIVHTFVNENDTTIEVLVIPEGLHGIGSRLHWGSHCLVVYNSLVNSTSEERLGGRREGSRIFTLVTLGTYDHACYLKYHIAAGYSRLGLEKGGIRARCYTPGCGKQAARRDVCL